MKNRLRYNSTAITLGALLAILLASSVFGQGDKTTADVHNVTVGAFTVKVPTGWRSFSASESELLRRQFMAQSEQIYRQYSNAKDPAGSVDIAAFHIAGDEGAFIIVSFTVPPQSDLINLLRSQAKDKMEWGIRQGYVKKDLGFVPLDYEQLSGFCIKALGNDGAVQISGGMEHNKLKNTLVQLTLLCPKAWDELKATDTLTPILKSVTLREK
jgi:hypothetical protein